MAGISLRPQVDLLTRRRRTAVPGPAARAGAARAGTGPYGVHVVAGGTEWFQSRPIGLFLSAGRGSARWRGYDLVSRTGHGFIGIANVYVSPRDLIESHRYVGRYGARSHGFTGSRRPWRRGRGLHELTHPGPH